MPLPLLQTKLYIPSPRQHLVSRPAITAKLGADGMHPLTLIAAPAGFGKTTLVSEWIAQARRERGQPVAWLSLDEDDNDPTRFLTYLIAALQTHQAQMGASARELLNTPQAPPPKAILTLLLNDLGTLTTPLAFVLDDYHLITTPAIHEALTFLVDHLPPSFRLVIISRIDPPLPLARWRVRNQLAEVRADDLRFTLQESAIFFNEVMGLPLSAVEIAALETRTEGWIAGLQLAALSLQGRADVAGFIQAFSGSNRHVLSYLVEEVLNRRPEGTLDFLLQTSILHQLSAPLCNAVTGRDDAQELLQKLDQANLFLIPLDDEQKCYRYHQLFADVLRTRLHQTQPQILAHLHQRASLWCEQNDRLPEAIQHALACPDHMRAAALIEQCKITFFFDPILQAMLHQWIALIPDEVVLRHPRLCVIHAWLLQGRIEVEPALGRLHAAEEALQQHPYVDPNQTRNVWHEILATRALLLAHAPQMDFAQVITLGEEVLRDAPPERVGLRSMAAGAIARAYLKQGALARGIFFLEQSLQILRAAQELYLTVAAAVNLALAQRAAGLLRAASATCREMIDWVAARANAPYPALGALHTTLADLLREENDLAGALSFANEGVALCDRWVYPYQSMLSRFVLLRIKQAQGDWAGVWATWQEVASHAEQAHFLPAPFLAVAKRQLLLWQGEERETAAWWRSSSWLEAVPATIITGQEYVYHYEYNRTVRAQVGLAQARATSDPALFQELLAHLARQQQAATFEGLLWLRIKVHCLQALTHAAREEREQAFAALDQAITLAEPEGYIRLFVDEGEPMRMLIAEWRRWKTESSFSVYISKLSAAFVESSSISHKPAAPIQPFRIPHPKLHTLVEPLSEREREVLQLVAAGLSNREIATRLIVTVGTVKTHINHILGKLSAQSRTQAIARGRALGLIQE